MKPRPKVQRLQLIIEMVAVPGSPTIFFFQIMVREYALNAAFLSMPLRMLGNGAAKDILITLLVMTPHIQLMKRRAGTNPLLFFPARFWLLGRFWPPKKLMLLQTIKSQLRQAAQNFCGCND